MKDCRGGSLKTGEETGGGLGRQCDFRDQHEGGLPGLEDLGDQPKVHLRFSASGDPEEQVTGESVANRGSDRLDGGRLVWIEIHDPVGVSGRSLRPGFDRGHVVQLDESDLGEAFEDRESNGFNPFALIASRSERWRCFAQ